MLENNRKNNRFLARMGAQGVLGQAVFDIAEDEKDFFAVTADLGVASGFSRFMQKYPERFVNVGIAEQNLLSVAAGIAEADCPVVATSWATFATYRCADQIRTFMGFMNKNIKLIGMGSGLHIPYFGGSHYGIGDVAVVNSIPNITIISPSDAREIYASIYASMNTNNPTYIRLTGGDFIDPIYTEDDYSFEIGKANIIKEGSDVCIITCGSILHEVIKCEQLLLESHISAMIVDMHTIKPLDYGLLNRQMDKKLIVCVEEHNIVGGLGDSVASYLSSKPNSPRVIKIGIEEFFPKAGSYDYLLEQCHLSGKQIAARIKKEVELYE